MSCGRGCRGCSTGEEAYSLAMTFKEVMEKLNSRKKITLQVFATDLDKDAINKARQGVYPENICADVSTKHLSRFFTKGENGYRVTTEIRGMVTFAPQSLIMDPPFTKLDILTCRNLLIYLAPEMQKKLIPLFHYSLTPGGILVLGSAETVGTFTDLFAALSNKLRIFRRTQSALRAEPIDFPSSFASRLPEGADPRPVPKVPASLQSVADHLVLEQYAPPAVLVDNKGNILYVSGRTGKYLEPASGKANWNIFVMAREGLRFELGNAFHKALEQEAAVVVRGIQIGTNGGKQHLMLTVQRLEQPEALHGLVRIMFADVAAAGGNHRRRAVPGKLGKTPARKVRLEALERKYQQARQEAQIVREEMQTSQEELRSTNEEQQSTNEELQSTNEELTTSKEEMQSLNEELQTVNTELQVKLDELSRTSSDMKNLLNSTDIATLFLDNNLLVRRFTTQATKIIKLIPGDVGRPITDLASDLLYPKLTDDAHEVLQKLGFSEKSIETTDGRWFTVRFMPYRTLDDRIDGVVITFSDITIAKTLEAKLREKHASLENARGRAIREAGGNDGNGRHASRSNARQKGEEHAGKSQRT